MCELSADSAGAALYIPEAAVLRAEEAAASCSDSYKALARSASSVSACCWWLLADPWPAV